MPTVTLQFNKGAFGNVDETEVADPAFAALQNNFLVTDAGSLVCRPALRNTTPSGGTSYGSSGAYPIIGMRDFSDMVVSVASSGHITKTVEAGTTTLITDPSTNLLETESTRCDFADDGEYLAIACGGTPKRWNGTDPLAEDMPGNPPDCTHIKYLDGYWIALLPDSQELRWAGPTEALREAWSSGDFIEASVLPDNANALTVEQRELFVFGEKSIEIFQNFGDSTVPFRPTFSIKKGTLSPYSIVQANNTHYFLNRDRQFVRLEGRTPVLISSQYDKQIKQFDTVSDCFGYAVEFNEHYLIVWTFPTEGRTLVYDYKHDVWQEFTSFNVRGEETRYWMNAYTFVPSWNVHLIGDYRDGDIYPLSTDRSLETSAYFTGPKAVRRSGYIDHGTGNYKRNVRYRFFMKRGNSPAADTALKAQSVLMIRFRDDDKGWSDPVEIGFGTTGNFSPFAELHSTGIYRRRQIELTLTDKADLILSKIEEDLEVMEH